MLARSNNGELHTILFEATHSETGELLIVHQNLENEQVYVTPASAFYSTSPGTDTNVPSFEMIDTPDDGPNHRLRALITLTSKSRKIESFQSIHPLA